MGLKIQDVIIDKSGLLVYANRGFEGVEGDVITVNGVQQPRFEVARGKYRFRILNGSDAREYRLGLSDNSVFHVIGSDHGLLPSPEPTRVLHIAPAERYEIIIDFARYSSGTRLVLQNRLDELHDRNYEDRFDPSLANEPGDGLRRHSPAGLHGTDPSDAAPALGPDRRAQSGPGGEDKELGVRTVRMASGRSTTSSSTQIASMPVRVLARPRSGAL